MGSKFAGLSWSKLAVLGGMAMAALSGGRASATRNPEDLARLFRRFAEELRHHEASFLVARGLAGYQDEPRADYFKAESTLPIDESVCLTATIDILRDIAKGSGPDKALLALGYAASGAWDAVVRVRRADRRHRIRVENAVPHRIDAALAEIGDAVPGLARLRVVAADESLARGSAGGKTTPPGRASSKRRRSGGVASMSRKTRHADSASST